MKSLIFAVLCFVLIAAVPTYPKRHVLIAGDSIALLNFPYLVDLIGDKVDLHIIPDNGGNSERLLGHFEEWATDPGIAWDVIYLNAGIHDTRIESEHDGFKYTSLEDYEANMRDVIQLAMAYAPRVIVRSCSPVSPGNEFGINPDDINKRNAVLRSLASEYGLWFHDMNAEIVADPNIERNTGGVHHTPESRPLIARLMAKPIILNTVAIDAGCSTGEP